MTGPAGSTTVTCSRCGATVTGGLRFCSDCGSVLAPATDEESPWAAVLERLRAATVGEFEIGRELGRGGMAAVFLAHEIALNRRVAIKVMAPGLMMAEGMVARFRREAVTVAGLSHPNIITIHGVRQADDLHFFVMKFVAGRPLDAVLAGSGQMPVDAVLALLFQVGSALAYAHRQGVVHRDVKPANVLLDTDGNAIVTDFGIAKVSEVAGQTQTGMTVGTPQYMSPEQCSAEPVTGASDQYALGAVAYELLTGAPPFGGTSLAIMHAHVNREPAPIRDSRPDCPPEVEHAVLRMLAKEPAERFPAIEDALRAMGAAPLAFDAPARQRLIELATPDPATQAANRIVAPTSPVPLSRSTPRATRSLPDPAGEPTQPTRGRWALRGSIAAGLAAAALGIWLVASRDASTAPPVPGVAAIQPAGAPADAARGTSGDSIAESGVVPSSGILRFDTGWPAGALLLVDGRATALPPSRSLALPPGPHQLQLTAPGYQPGLKEMAVRASDTASVAFRLMPVVVAVSKPDTQKQPSSLAALPTNAPVPPAPQPALPAEQRPPDPGIAAAAEVRQAILDYARAINGRSTAAMRTLYPGMPTSLQNEWSAVFGPEIDQLKVEAEPGDIAASANLADARFTLSLSFTPRGGTAQQRRIACRASLRKDPAGWRFVTIDQRPSS